MAAKEYRTTLESMDARDELLDYSTPNTETQFAINAPQYQSTYAGAPLQEIASTLDNLENSYWQNKDEMEQVYRGLKTMEVNEKDAFIYKKNLDKYNASMSKILESGNFERAHTKVSDLVTDITTDPENIMAMKDNAKIKAHNAELDAQFKSGELEAIRYYQEIGKQYQSVNDPNRRVNDNLIRDLDFNQPIARFDYDGYIDKLKQQFEVDSRSSTRENFSWAGYTDEYVLKTFGIDKQTAEIYGISPEIITNGYKIQDASTGYDPNEAVNDKAGLKLTGADRFVFERLLSNPHALQHAKEMADAENADNAKKGITTNITAGDFIISKMGQPNEAWSSTHSISENRKNNQFGSAIIGLRAGLVEEAKYKYDLTASGGVAATGQHGIDETDIRASLNIANTQIEELTTKGSKGGIFDINNLSAIQQTQYNNAVALKNNTTAITNEAIYQLAVVDPDAAASLIFEEASGFFESVDLAGYGQSTSNIPIERGVDAVKLEFKNRAYIKDLITNGEMPRLLKEIESAKFNAEGVLGVIKNYASGLLGMSPHKASNTPIDMSEVYRKSVEELTKRNAKFELQEVNYNVIEHSIDDKVVLSQGDDEPLLSLINDKSVNLMTFDGRSNAQVMAQLDSKYSGPKNQVKTKIASEGLCGVGTTLYWKTVYDSGGVQTTEYYNVPSEQLDVVTNTYIAFAEKYNEPKLKEDMHMLAGKQKFGYLFQNSAAIYGSKVKSKIDNSDKVYVPTRSQTFRIANTNSTIITYPGELKADNISRVNSIILPNLSSNEGFVDENGNNLPKETQDNVKLMFSQINKEVSESIKVDSRSGNTNTNMQTKVETIVKATAKKYGVDEGTALSLVKFGIHDDYIQLVTDLDKIDKGVKR